MTPKQEDNATEQNFVNTLADYTLIQNSPETLLLKTYNNKECTVTVISAHIIAQLKPGANNPHLL